jgi:hypothetical protein
MVKELSNVRKDYSALIKAVKRTKSDCSNQEVDNVTELVQSLIREKPDISQLTKVHTTIRNQVEVICKRKGSQSPNLEKLAKKVDDLIHSEYPSLMAKLFVSDKAGFKKAIKKIKDPDILFQTAMLCAEEGPEGVATNIKEFKLKGDEEKLYELARACKSPKHISLFKKEGLKSQEMLFSLALRYIENEATVEEAFVHMQDFAITDKMLILTLAKGFASKVPSQFIQHLHNFVIESQVDLVKVIKICAEADPVEVTKNILKLGVESEGDRTDIAKICAQGDGYTTAESFKNFQITDEKDKTTIAELCLKFDRDSADYFDKFEISQDNDRERLAIIYVKSGSDVSQKTLNKFKITDQKQLVHLVRLSILTHSHSSTSTIPSKLHEGVTKELIDLTYCANFLNSSLNMGETEHFRSDIYPDIEMRVKSHPRLGELKLTFSSQKECCIAYMLLALLGDRPQNEVSLGRLKRIINHRNGPITLCLLSSIYEENAVVNEVFSESVAVGGKAQEHLFLPMTLVAKWGAECESVRSLHKLRDSLHGSRLKKEFIKSGGSVEKAWLRTCKSLDGLEGLNPEKKIKILNFAVNYLDSKDPKGDSIKRLNTIQSLCGSKRLDLLNGFMKKFESEIETAHSLEEVDQIKVEIFDKTIQKKSLDRRRKELESALKSQIPEIDELEIVSKERGALDKELKRSGASSNEKAEAMKPLNSRKRALEIKIKNAKSSQESLSRTDEEIKELDKEIQALTLDIRKSTKAIQAKNKAEELIKNTLSKMITESLFSCMTEVLLTDDYLNLEGIENVADRYSTTFGKMRVPGAWLIYSRNVRRTGEEEVQEAFNTLVRGILENTYKQDRYEKDSSPHASKIMESHSKVWEAWQADDPGGSVEITTHSKKQYEIINTDDWEDLFLSGTEIEGSCLEVGNAPSTTKCLMSYLLDGKHRMIALKDPDTEKVIARSMFRLLWDDTNNRPVLHLEVTYPKSAQLELKEAIIEYAKKEAEKLDCSLFLSDKYKGSVESQDKIVSLGGRAPYEYVDSAGGVFERGVYEMQTPHCIQKGKYELA